MKHWIFRSFPWIAISVLTGAIAAAFLLGVQDKIAVLGGISAGVLGFCYFVQQQRLAETQLFVDLFTRFNARYDQMNDRLSAISERRPITESDRHLIVDYLNLCAEEYLFFTQGYIQPEVWRSWCRGMEQYLKLPPIRAVWLEEASSGSYYGLTAEAIRQGAA